jgi:hypothetical protein
MHPEIELVPCGRCCATGMEEREKRQCLEFWTRNGIRHWRCQLREGHPGTHVYPPQSDAPKS